ncbi:hypothetical protein BHAOGJBA_0619 [Methylobacterium hispanicum]|uniref:Bro-N domain-containing protein n=2 Tax=Methylobacterium hispanicum TaxID=270350 RepID=A0AAV4ZGR9_9HYPH|nr:hypothetical protein BHAOGJBA_0619 [Methylobacterium hispanicum]
MTQASLNSTTALAPVAPSDGAVHDPMTFSFALQGVRVVMVDGEPQFVANDVARALQLADAAQSLDKLDADERGRCSVPTPGGLQAVRTVTESGLYTLILRCRGATTPGTLPHRFRKWVTGEVLPQIRRAGSYGAPAPAQGAAALMDLLKNPAAALELIGHYASANLALQERVEAAAPAVAFQEALVASDDTWGLQQAGKALGQAPNGFVNWLLGRSDIYRRAGSLCGRQYLIDRGILTVRWEPYGGKPRPVTKITGKGVVHYAKLLGVKPPSAPAQGLLPGL